jgi:putative ubiquitin-RnfH superfamily antitoxin RatB of RatAB toxin-antitoxin module
MNVIVAYALPDVQTLLTIEVGEGCTLEQALALSGILLQHPEINWAHNKAGVNSRVRPMHTILKAGDRVEIYRPRVADPKTERRTRASLQAKPL